MVTIDLDTLARYSDTIVAEHGTSQRALIPILHAVQQKYNYLPEAALRRVCEITEITPAAVTGVSTFYSRFRHIPVGRHLVSICNGTACHVKGAERVYDAFFRERSIPAGGDTDPEEMFTVQKVACLGCCTLAPVVQIDGVTYGHVSPDTVADVIDDFFSRSRKKTPVPVGTAVDATDAGIIRIGEGSCCVAGGSGLVREELETCLAETGIAATVRRVGCVGMCHRTPLLEIERPGRDPVLYDRVQPGDVRRMLLTHYTPPSSAKRLLHAGIGFLERFVGDGDGGMTRYPVDMRDAPVTSFLGRQVHIATEHAGSLDPLDLAEYRATGGFDALERCLTVETPDSIIGTVRASGLRGRGGAGFPTGRKWDIVRHTADTQRYIVCNGDEGDPGAFMDRMILESYPFRVIEGMIIAARAVGAHEGFLYIRAEYPLAVERVNDALAQCSEANLLGSDILGTGYSLDLAVMEGAGAFVCGEETALIASIEGRRGMPSFRPPYPADRGIGNHPTLVNNCETFASVPWIFRNGADAFSQLGTPESPGTKVFSLAGKIARGGLIEVPMGITIREIVEEIGGGIEGGGRFKAVQIGGPSGGCIPASLAGTRVDYEDLTNVHAMMGSGGLLVMDEHDCMVDIARYFLAFTCDQSCGKCTYCRVGLRLMLEILNRICAGDGSREDIDQLEHLARRTKEGSLCGLGKTAPNPVLTTLMYFRDEYEAHLAGTCPAKQCHALITYEIDDTCIGCTICAQKCPADAIAIKPHRKHEIDHEQCIKCGTCREVCPTGSVEVR